MHIVKNVHTACIKNGLLDIRIMCVISEVVLCQQRVLHLNTPVVIYVHVHVITIIGSHSFIALVYNDILMS